MSGHHCKDWSETAATAGQRRAANRHQDRHVAKYPKCEPADVCVHTGLFTSAFCCGCGRKIQ